MLLQLRERLAHGTWERWLVEHLPFTLSTAKRAIRLHDIRRDQPALFARLTPLGVAKAYLFANLPEDTFAELLSRAHTVPSSGANKTVSAMTFAELMEVLAARDAEEDLDRAAILVRSYCRQVRALIRAIDDLVEGHELVAGGNVEDDLAELYDDTHGGRRPPRGDLFHRGVGERRRAQESARAPINGVGRAARAEPRRGATRASSRRRRRQWSGRNGPIAVPRLVLQVRARWRPSCGLAEFLRVVPGRVAPM